MTSLLQWLIAHFGIIVFICGVIISGLVLFLIAMFGALTGDERTGKLGAGPAGFIFSWSLTALIINCLTERFFLSLWAGLIIAIALFIMFLLTKRLFIKPDQSP